MQFEQSIGRSDSGRIREFYIDFSVTPERQLFIDMNTYHPGECALFRKLLIARKFNTELYRKKLLRVGYRKEYNNMCTYEIFGKLHREDGPALVVVGKNGKPRRMEWFYNGKFHRDDGPACVHMYDGKIDYELWFEHGA